MLVTHCKHCGARFRVTPEQLNLRQGQVRCGQCQEVFNGFESLERFPGDDTGARLLAHRAGKGGHPDPIAELADIDLGRRLVPESRPPEPSPPHADSPAPLKETPEAPRRAEASPATVRVHEESAASFSPAQPVRPSRAWTFGVTFLALLLALQLVYAFRATLAQQYPVLRPYLEAVCGTFRCTVPWVNDEAALKLEDSELLEVPGKPGQIALQARIRNLSQSAQEFPHLELTLTDVSGQTAVRRVLRPADYMGRTPATEEVMAAGSEVQLSVRIETGRVRPTGYELLLFYP